MCWLHLIDYFKNTFAMVCKSCFYVCLAWVCAAFTLFWPMCGISNTSKQWIMIKKALCSTDLNLCKGFVFPTTTQRILVILSTVGLKIIQDIWTEQRHTLLWSAPSFNHKDHLEFPMIKACRPRYFGGLWIDTS